jgi:RNA-directed DNA polymerase
MLKGEVLVQGYRLDWSRMQKELQGVRISAVDRFVNSKVEYNRKGGKMTVTEDLRDPNGSRNTSHFEDESWESKPWKKFEKVVFRLQQRIYKASRDGNGRKVKKLQRLLLKCRSAKFLAVRQVTQLNTGKKTPGIDGKANLNDRERLQLVKELQRKSQNWNHREVRRIFIPKKSEERRPLGIPTISDRAWEALIKLALEPAAEADFHPRSYGSRPGRSIWDAAQDIFNSTKSQAINFSGKILELDVEKCFDRIDQKYLMQAICLPKQYKMGVWKALKAGVRVGYDRYDTNEGTPQGGVFSPLLANLALHGIENIGKCIRYMDDMVFIIQKDEDPEEMRKQIDKELLNRGLQVKESKTRVTEMADGFDFLGVHFKLLGKPAIRSKRFPVKDWLKETKRKINHILKEPLNDETKVEKIQRICRGKIQYYKYCDLGPVQDQWWKLNNKIYKRFGVAITPVKYNSTGYLKIKGDKSPFDGDVAYWVKRMNKKYDGIRRDLIRSQDTKCPMCNLRLSVTDEIHVHHVNHDHSDNQRQNLQVVHRACHQIHHRL